MSVPLKSVHRTTSKQGEPTISNISTISNPVTEQSEMKSYKTPKPKFTFQKNLKSEQIKSIRKQNKTTLGLNKSFNEDTDLIIRNFIENFIQNHLNPLEKRLGKLNLQIDSNERLISETKTIISKISKSTNDNRKEFEITLDNIKNILIGNHASKLVTQTEIT